MPLDQGGSQVPVAKVVNRNDDSAHLGRIENVAAYAIFVIFSRGRLGRIFYNKIPGCERPEGLGHKCQIGDKIFVKISNVNDHGDIDLDCVEFPVKSH